ncbi:MAG TPA: polyphosphate polymerase domain-containing protein [Bacteroidales bacterium]|nr:polyphosphate polymerase domain-containing protein [Bacteroidales bacterium]
MDEILKILDSFDPISLEEMNEVKLLNRVDTKFTFNISYLPGILKALVSDYRILSFGDIRTNHYETLYYDTKDFNLFRQHQCGKLNRYKVRYRCYKDTDVTFFEVKFKSNKSRTLKQRFRMYGIEEQLSEETKRFVLKKSTINPDTLLARLWVKYKRITLVNKSSRERLTIDLNLTYESNGKTVSYPNLVIAELKQDKSTKSFFALLMRDIHIPRVSISKYCFGIYSVYDNIRINNFKPKFRIVKKSHHDTIKISFSSAIVVMLSCTRTTGHRPDQCQPGNIYYG